MPINKPYMVYVHTNKVDGKRYVGITCQNPARRWRNGNGYYLNDHFYRAINKYGWDNFTHEIIKAGLSKEAACELEKRLINEYRTNDPNFGYNKSEGGENPCQGFKMSKETRAVMSAKRKGRPMSEETKRKLSEAKKGKDNGKRGKVGELSETAGLVIQISLETGEVVAIYHGYNEMSRETGFAKSPVKRAASGEQQKSYGYKWKYIKGVKNVPI